jgi:hypothetical protein
MIAGLFAQLGCWSGTCRGPRAENPKGFWENQILKRLILSEVGRGHTSRGELAPVPDGWRDLWHKHLVEDGYAGGPWMVKHSAVYYKLWEGFDPIYVVCWRDRESILRSWSSTYGGSMASIDRHHAIMHHIPGHAVSTPALIAGEHPQALIDASKEAGLEWDDKIYRDWIDPNSWHYLPPWVVADAGARRLMSAHTAASGRVCF